MIKYITKYTDNSGSIDTIIENYFDEKEQFCLYMKIEGIMFKATSFDDFELMEHEKYSKEQLRQFTFNKVGIHNSENFVYELCNCKIQFEIPILLIEFQTNKDINALLKVDLELGKPASNGGIDYEQATFSLDVKDKKFKATADVFETGLDNLKKQIGNNFHFKNCFGCQYADYSPYGNGFYGNMLCFRNHKKEYLNANSKVELLEVANRGFIQVQETYCCGDFEIRKPNTGYRG